ncbi:uncharacterized protein LOC591592 isoform X2 [Strongylocentrotus purpuratus]|uniref:B30.2/SPRY domain-containing protein n=1 Tax=Strongylocentrotus purpuratus TaxID=7668 RepID=A0A7M7SYW5_STRPU|nr:uncharacterized protein LOC591592 isoform X2 [Strongylocentrotus purpuratus]
MASKSPAMTLRSCVVILCGTAGVGMAGFALVKYLRSWLRQVVSRNLEQRIEDGEAFLYVLKSCRSSDEEKALQACTALCVILKSVDQRVFQVDLFILQTLVTTLSSSMDRWTHYRTHIPDVDFPDRMQRMTLATIYDLSTDPAFLSKLEQMKSKDLAIIVLELLEKSRNKEVQRYSLLLLLQMTMQGKNCASVDAFRIIGEKSVFHHGDVMLQKICYQLLVTLTNAQSTDATLFIHEIAQQDALVPMVVSTKSDDVEVSFWSVALLHEFAVHNVCRKELCELPCLVTNLQATLMASEAAVQRLILRIFAFLALRNDPFARELMKNKALISHLPTCLASGNKDVVHWALVLVHDLAMMGRQALEKLLDYTNDALIKSLLSLSTTRDNMMLRLLAETLGLFCGCEQLPHRLVRAGALEMILSLAQSHDPDLVFWASALLLNLAMTSDAVKVEILASGGLKTLIDLSLGDHENGQITTMAAKTLVMMAVLDEPIHVYVRCERDSATVVIEKKTLQLTHPGINITMWETLLSKKLQVWHYTPSNEDDLASLIRKVSNIPILDQQSKRTCERNMVIFTINGPQAPLCLKALENRLRFKIYSKSGVVTSDPLDLDQGQSCCIVANVDADCELDVMHISKNQEPIAVQLQVSGALVVNQRIRTLILLPLLHRIMAVPANSPINRVSDLELLEVLVRHESQKNQVLECQAVVDQLVAMVNYFAQQGVDQLKSEPLAVAHSHGALRVLRVLAMYDHYRSVLLTADTVAAVVNLLNGLVNFWLNAILSTQQQGQVGSRPITRMGSRPVSRAGYRTDDSVDTASLFLSRPHSRAIPSALGLGDDPLDEVDLESTAESLALIERNLAEAVSAITNTVQQLAASQPLHHPPPPPRNRRLRSSSDSVSMATDSNLAAEVEDAEDKSEESQMTNHLSKFAVLTIAHLLNTCDDDISRAVQSSLHLSGAMYALWATLLCSSESMKATALPVAIAMTKLAATDMPVAPDNTVKLDVTTRTPALLVSADHLEIRNDSWTFESIIAVNPLPHVKDGEVQSTNKHLEGWYYEVEVKSNGIIQVGWATKQCTFGPEKGLGVGDDLNSCAFDGARCRKWNGPITETLNNEYGLEWQVGDVVSCLMDRHGNASFWLRGINMGVAFQGLDLNQDWYPACSLSTDQHIRFNFGDSTFRYSDVIPDGYIPFCQAHQGPDLPFQDDFSVFPDIKPLSQIHSSDGHYHDSLTSESGLPEMAPLQEPDLSRDVESIDYIDDGNDGAGSDFGYAEMGGEAFAEMTDSPRHVAMAKIAQVDASLQQESYSLYRQAFEKRFEPIRHSEAGSGDQAGPIGIQGSEDAEGGGEAEEFQPPPSLYFEVNISHVDRRPVVIGFCSADASVQVCAVLTEEDELVMPDNSLQQVPKCPVLTIGCALLIPPGVVFFTVNGQPIRRLFNFLQDDQPSQPLTPCTNSPYLNVNFGQDRFLYEPANEFEQRIYMAALLHDYCEQTMNT